MAFWGEVSNRKKAPRCFRGAFSCYIGFVFFAYSNPHREPKFGVMEKVGRRRFDPYCELEFGVFGFVFARFL
jgi:hypothetical protein